MPSTKYQTRSGITVARTVSTIPFNRGLKPLLRELDDHRGIYLSSGYEYPERYSRWDIASLRPPLEIIARKQNVEFHALNQRGVVLLDLLEPALAPHPHWASTSRTPDAFRGELKPLPALFPEEERSKQPSAFSILRALIQEFKTDKDSRLALVGAFGYDLLFQFDPIDLKLPRNDHKDLHLF